MQDIREEECLNLRTKCREAISSCPGITSASVRVTHVRPHPGHHLHAPHRGVIGHLHPRQITILIAACLLIGCRFLVTTSGHQETG